MIIDHTLLKIYIFEKESLNDPLIKCSIILLSKLDNLRINLNHFDITRLLFYELHTGCFF